METVISRDGTRVAFYRRGAGEPLVLVHGTGAANPAITWTAVLPRLEERLCVCAMDRRGRGGSGDGTAYALEREAEDVAAVVDAMGKPVHLLGHSFGGLCALEACLLTPNVRRLILYEPLSGAIGGGPLYPPGMVDRLEAMLEKDDRDGVLELFYRDVAGLSRQEVEQLRSSPAWGARRDAAHTIPRELRAEERYRLDARRLEHLRVATLLLGGGESPPSLRLGLDQAAAALPNSRVVLMPGQQHVAMYSAPDLFAREVLAFLPG